MGIYFSGDFTVSAWVYPIQIANANRLIDFGTGPLIDNVITGLSRTTGVNNPFSILFDGSKALANIVSPVLLQLNKWQHVWIKLAAVVGV